MTDPKNINEIMAEFTDENDVLRHGSLPQAAASIPIAARPATGSFYGTTPSGARVERLPAGPSRPVDQQRLRG